jgi:hypothetical protein
MKKLLSFLILSVILTPAVNVIAQTVYTNKADSKYHLLTCKYLDPSHDSLDMAFAIKKGFGACPVCKPSVKGASSSGSMGSMGDPKSMDAPKSMEKSGMGQQVNSTTNASSKQCAAIEKDGKRCIEQTEPGSVYCWGHRNYKK